MLTYHPTVIGVAAGQVQISGLRLDLNNTRAMALAAVSVQLTPPTSLLAALQRRKHDTNLSNPRIKPQLKAQLASLTVALQDASLDYDLSVSVPSELRMDGTPEAADCRLTISLSDITCNADLLERSAQCSLSMLTITHAESPLANPTPTPFVSPIDTEAPSESLSPLSAAQYARLAWAGHLGEGNAGDSHVRGQEAGVVSEGRKVVLLRLGTATLSADFSVATIHGDVGVNTGRGHLVLDLSLADLRACFDTDATFTLLAFSSEAVTAVRASGLLNPPVSRMSRGNTSGQRCIDPVSAAYSRVHVSGRSVDRKRLALTTTVQLTRAELVVPLNDGFTFVAEVR